MRRWALRNTRWCCSWPRAPSVSSRATSCDWVACRATPRWPSVIPASACCGVDHSRTPPTTTCYLTTLPRRLSSSAISPPKRNTRCQTRECRVPHVVVRERLPRAPGAVLSAYSPSLSCTRTAQFQSIPSHARPLPTQLQPDSSVNGSPRVATTSPSRRQHPSTMHNDPVAMAHRRRASLRFQNRAIRRDRCRFSWLRSARWYARSRAHGRRCRLRECCCSQPSSRFLVSDAFSSDSGGTYTVCRRGIFPKSPPVSSPFVLGPTPSMEALAYFVFFSTFPFVTVLVDLSTLGIPNWPPAQLPLLPRVLDWWTR
eukprot:ctg_1269.g466